MPVQILQFRPRFGGSRDWSQRELAEFYRVENALLQAGLTLESDRGVSDEGDPWYVFCRRDSADVFIHFARIDGEYVIDGAPYAQVARHVDFSALVKDLISSELLAMARPRRKDSNIFVHPAALLIALVGAAFFHSGKADAAESADHRTASRRQAGGITLYTASGDKTVLGLDAAQTATVLSGVMIGISQQLVLPTPPASSAAAPAMVPVPDVAFAPQAGSAGSTAASARALAPPSTSDTPLIMTGIITWSQSGVASVGNSMGAAQAVAALQIVLPEATTYLAAMRPEPVVVAQPDAKPFLLSASVPVVLPVDEAGAAVQAASAEEHAPLALTGTIPALIAELIGRGQHVAPTGPDTPPPPAVVSTETTPAQPAPSTSEVVSAAPQTETPAAPGSSQPAQPDVSTAGPPPGATPAPTSPAAPDSVPSSSPSPEAAHPAAPADTPVSVTSPQAPAGPPPAPNVAPPPSTSTVVASTPPATPVTPAPVSPVTPAAVSPSTPAAVSPATPALATDPTHGTTVVVVTPATASPPPPPVVVVETAAHHDAYINAVVAGFMAEAQHWQVIVDGRNLVVYDTLIFGHQVTETKLDSITFTFSDGSSVSLVGTAQEIVDTYHVRIG